jgi:acyl-CoA thioesterase
MALAALLDLQELGGDTFRGINTREGTYWPRVFGGQLIAQALVAACRTVEPTLACHSLHAYFLAPGDTREEVYFTYHVTRLREGRSFAARRVAAEQSGVCIFEMLASFQRPESSAFVRQQPAPGRLAGVRAPERLSTQAALLRLRAADARLPAPLRVLLAARADIPFPLVRCSSPAVSCTASHSLRVRTCVFPDPGLHRTRGSRPGCAARRRYRTTPRCTWQRRRTGATSLCSTRPRCRTSRRARGRAASDWPVWCVAPYDT